MATSKVSIIVPIFQVEAYLQRALDSLKKQTLEETEILQVDDGSPDGSAAIADEHCLLYDNFSVIHTSNAGLSASRNKGIELSSGDYLGFLDPDDYVEANMYMNLLDTIKKSSGDIAICGFIQEYGDGTTDISNVGISNEAREKLGQSWPQYLLSSFIIGELAGAYAWNKLYRQKLIVDNNLRYREGIQLTEDTLFFFNLLGSVEKLGICDQPLYHYIRRENSICGNTRRDGLDAYLLKFKQEENLLRQFFKDKKQELTRLMQFSYMNCIKTCKSFLQIYAKKTENPGQIFQAVDDLFNNEFFRRIVKLSTNDHSGNHQTQCLQSSPTWIRKTNLLIMYWLPATAWRLAKKILGR